jgi:nucleoside-diphosphate-sugar epimerase
MTRKTGLVVGATGMVGERLVHELLEAGWNVVGICRRPPATAAPGCLYLHLDVADAAACNAAMAAQTGITHLFYAGRHAHTTTAPEPIEINVAMLRNVLDALEAHAPGLEHVHAVHGGKVYGSTLGPYKTPAKETDPRVLADTFYYGQEDLLRARQAGTRWTWTTSRPLTICDTDAAIVRNLPRLIAVYAAISRELALDLHFPGKALAYTSLYQVTDARHLARAIRWVASTPRCANEIFNVTNGDHFRWVHLWPALADALGMRAGVPRPVRLGDVMFDKAPVWDRVVAQHGLRATSFADAAIWPYGDFVMGHEYDVMSDTTKLRQFGFHDAIDSREMFIRMFDALREARIVP